jgi:hypothetical protein
VHCRSGVPLLDGISPSRKARFGLLLAQLPVPLTLHCQLLGRPVPADTRAQLVAAPVIQLAARFSLFFVSPTASPKEDGSLLAYKYQDQTALPSRGASFSCMNGECAPYATSSAARSE